MTIKPASLTPGRRIRFRNHAYTVLDVLEDVALLELDAETAVGTAKIDVLLREADLIEVIE